MITSSRSIPRACAAARFLRKLASSIVAVLALPAALLLPAPDAAAAPPTQLGVYRWAAPGGPNNVNVYSAWLGQPNMWAEDFLAKGDWTQIQGPAWILNPWRDWVAAQPGRRLILSVPMLPDTSGTSLATGATGAYNGHFQTLAQNLVAKGLGNSILRIGWEFNGGWYRWAASNKQTDFINYWRHIVTAMRAVPGAQNLQFCWNPVYGYQQFPAETAYPGDNYVDVIALDIYDECWSPNTYPIPANATPAEIATRRANAWSVLHSGNRGLVFWRDFAAARGKPFALGEWGVNVRADGHGGGDNPTFIENMHAFMTNNPVAWAVYFDVQAPDGHHQLSPTASGTDFVLSRAKFLELFGGGALFADDFDDGDANGWSATPSTHWSVVNDSGSPVYQFAFDWNNTSGASTAGNAAWTNYTVAADVKITAINTWSDVRLYARHVDANNHYYAAIVEENGAAQRRVQIKRRLNGVTTNLASSAWLTVNTHTWYSLEFELQGNQLRARLNGNQVAQATDSSIAAGRIGLGGYKQSVRFDNVTVDN